MSISVAITHPPETLAELDEHMTACTLHGLAQNTLRNLKTHINTYVQFCMVYKLSPFPVDTLQMHRDLQYLSYQYQSIDSSMNYTSGVRTLHLLMGFEPPNPQDYLYQLTAKGVRCDKGHVVKQACPVTPELLASMLELVNVCDSKQLACWVAILLGFYSLFHKSNLVLVSGVKYNPTKQLSSASFTRYADCYVASMYWAKNIQFHDRAHDIPILPNIDRRICPVSWLDYYFSRNSGAPGDPALCYVKKGVLMPLNYSQLTEQMRDWVEKLGYPKKAFISHSLHRGGTQFLVQCGIPAHVIQLIGAWKSNTYQKYLDLSLQAHYDTMVLINASMNTL